MLESGGLADDWKKSGFFERTCALAWVRPGVGLPPWQSVQPRTTFGDACISSMPWWHSRQPTLFSEASLGVWSIQLRIFVGFAFETSCGTEIGGPNPPRSAAVQTV